MCAVIAVLNESLTEGLRGFYKLRKAYMTLNGILEAESSFIRRRSAISLAGQSTRSATSAKEIANGQSVHESEQRPKTTPKSDANLPNKPDIQVHEPTGSLMTIMDRSKPRGHGDEVDEENDGLFDADEVPDAHPQGISSPHDRGPEGSAKEMGDVSLSATSERLGVPALAVPPSSEDEIYSYIWSNPIDTFIHSGSNVCFGMLLVMISMIPPAFGKLLSIIGFKGDRGRGLRMLWSATRIPNANGAMAGLILLGFYNGIFAFCDITPEDDDDDDDHGHGASRQENLEGYPKKRCEELLANMRARYPQSHLCLLEEARMQLANGRLEDGINLLGEKAKSQMKQVDALAMFEQSLSFMYLHRHEMTTECFLKARLNPLLEYD